MEIEQNSNHRQKWKIRLGKILTGLGGIIGLVGLILLLRLVPQLAKSKPAKNTGGDLAIGFAVLMAGAGLGLLGAHLDTSEVVFQGKKRETNVEGMVERVKKTDAEIAEIKLEIMDLASKLRAWQHEDGKTALRRLETEARKIGSRVYQLGGEKMMARILDDLRNNQGVHTRGVEMCWDGIGNFRG